MVTGDGKRRRAVLGACVITLVVSGIASAPVAFMASSFLPAAWWAIPVIVAVFSAAAWWVMRDQRRAEQAEQEQAPTEVLSLAEIAGHQPVPPRRSTAALRLRRICGRAHNVKEGAL